MGVKNPNDARRALGFKSNSNSLRNGKAGNSLVSNPVKENIKVPLSVKFRLGWDRQNKNFIEFGQLMQEAGADFVTLHGRCRSDRVFKTVSAEQCSSDRSVRSRLLLSSGP